MCLARRPNKQPFIRYLVDVLFAIVLVNGGGRGEFACLLKFLSSKIYLT